MDLARQDVFTDIIEARRLSIHFTNEFQVGFMGMNTSPIL